MIPEIIAYFCESHSNMSMEKGLHCQRDEIEQEDTSSGEVITQPFSPNEIQLSNPPMNIGDLIDMIQYGWIDFNTEYQRAENLWPPGKQSRLIESALLGLRLPSFYFEEVSMKHWKIIDGLQRCCAIKNFCVTEELELCNLEFLTFNGYKFSTLPFELRRDIRMLPISVNLLKSGAPDKVKYILFKRLNTGGVELEPQEIRNAVFQGPAVEVVKEMAKNPEFIKATGGKIPTARMQDQDFVSRFIAFYLIGAENYMPDLDNFVNTSMERINKGVYDDRVIEAMKFDFGRSMELAYTLFGKDAFRKRENKADKKKPINKAYFEVIAVSLAKIGDDDASKLIKNQELFVDNLIQMMKSNKTYNDSFSGGTGKRDKVKKRFSVFGDVLSMSINGQKLG